MKFKKIMAVALAAASLGTMAVTASAECDVDYSTGAITWTFVGEKQNFFSDDDIQSSKRYFSYSNDLTRLKTGDGENSTDVKDVYTAKSMVSDKELLFEVTKGSRISNEYIGDGLFHEAFYKNMNVYYKAPSNGKLTISAAYGANKTDSDATDTIKELTKDETCTLSGTSSNQRVFKITFTPATATQYYTFDTADQNGAVFSKLSLTNTMYGDTRKASLNLPAEVSGGMDIVGAIENVPESAELTVTME